MRAYLPVATDGGEPIEGLERSDFVVRQPVVDRSLGERRHIPYAVVNPDDPRNTLAVRDAPGRIGHPGGQFRTGDCFR